MWKMCSAHFFCFSPGKPFLGKSGQKDQNYQFKRKFGTKTDLNMQNSMMMFTFSVFDHKYFSWANLVKNFGPSCLVKVEFDSKTNSNAQNSMAV